MLFQETLELLHVGGAVEGAERELRIPEHDLARQAVEDALGNQHPFGIPLQEPERPCPQRLPGLAFQFPAFEGREVPGCGDGGREIDSLFFEIVVERAAHGQVVGNAPLLEIGRDRRKVVHLEQFCIEGARVGDLRLAIPRLNLFFPSVVVRRGTLSQGACGAPS